MNPNISIILPCRNERSSIAQCVESILAQEAPQGGFEIIVADGCSDDGTREILERLTEENERLRVIDNPGRIVSTGLNAAIRASRGTIIVRMDAHSEYAVDYLKQCVAVLHESAADNVGGPWVAKGKGFIGQAIAAAFQSPFAVGGARGHDPGYEGVVDTVYLGSWPREVFDRIGFFDEELVRNQDDEFNLRLTRNGGKIWQSPRIKSWYHPRESLRALLRQYLQYGYWKVRVIQKHKLPASMRHLVPGLFVLLFGTLPILAFWWPLMGWAWLGVVGTYLLAIVGASWMSAAQEGWRFLPVLPFVFACYHFGYGYGFLRGVWDFVICRRGPQQTYIELTRPSENRSGK